MLDRNGILHLSGQDTIAPGLHEAAFLQSPLGQASESNGSNDGWSRYRVRGTLDNKLNCAAGLYFFNGRLRLLTFGPHWPGSARSWREWSEEGQLRVPGPEQSTTKRISGTAALCVHVGAHLVRL